MAFGLPVAGWRAGNLRYLADDGREGLLVAPGDVGALARALQRLATDPPLRERLGAAARRRAVARPTWDEAAALFFGAIREALAAAPPAQPLSAVASWAAPTRLDSGEPRWRR
jgi:glycosyltransferase involved in cell wall biosynthesis